MRQALTLLALSVFALFSCNNATNSTGSTATDSTATAAPKPATAAQSKLGDAGTQKLMAVVSDYYKLKDALVATKAGEADAAANKLIASAGDLQQATAQDSSAGLKNYIDTIVSESRAMTAMMDEGCEKKRVNFERISTAMFDMLKKADLKNAGVYREYCPMAFNEKGAYWLSNTDVIKNPYFGDKMLECGEVADSLK